MLPESRLIAADSSFLPFQNAHASLLACWLHERPMRLFQLWMAAKLEGEDVQFVSAEVKEEKPRWARAAVDGCTDDNNLKIALLPSRRGLVRELLKVLRIGDEFAGGNGGAAAAAANH